MSGVPAKRQVTIDLTLGSDGDPEPQFQERQISSPGPQCSRNLVGTSLRTPYALDRRSIPDQNPIQQVRPSGEISHPGSNQIFPSAEALINRHQALRGSSQPRLPSVGSMADNELDEGDEGSVSDTEAVIHAAMAEMEQGRGLKKKSYYRRRKRPWADHETAFLVEQVNQYGSAWQLIWENNQEDCLAIHPERTTVDYKDKAMTYKIHALMYRSSTY